MYSPTPFFLAKVISSIMIFMIYPFTLSLTVIWFLGLPVIGIEGFCTFWLILLLQALVGMAMGITMGAIIPNIMEALNANLAIIMILSFGGGFYANTGTGASLLVQLISWVSPIKYSTELLLRRFFQGKPEELFADVIYE